MKAALIFVFTALLLLSTVEAKKKEYVVSLTDKDFETSVHNAENTPYLVKFFAPWCTHCQKLAPEYEKAAESLAGEKVVLAQVDCTVATHTCQDQEVHGYPTVKFFTKNNVVEYTDERKRDAIEKFIKRQMKPSVTIAKTTQEANDLDNSDTTVFGYFPNNECPEFVAFSQACEQRRQFVDCFAIIGEATTMSIKLTRESDNAEEQFQGKFTVEDISNWIKMAMVPLVDEISATNARTYVSATIPVGYLYADIADPSFKALKEAMITVAKQHREVLLFTYVDSAKYARMARSHSLSGEKFPAFSIETPEKVHYVLSEGEPITVEILSEFVTKFVEHKVQPTLRSQPVPTQQGDVYELVGNTFKDIVMDAKKDVLVKFFAPWCGHCKAMAPAYEELAKDFAGVKDKVVIAEMDGTENDAPSSIHITGFPTIMFFPANQKEGMPLKGARTAENMKKFVLENATTLSKEEIASIEGAAPAAPAAEEKPAPPTPAAASELHHDL